MRALVVAVVVAVALTGSLSLPDQLPSDGGKDDSGKTNVTAFVVHQYLRAMATGYEAAEPLPAALETLLLADPLRSVCGHVVNSPFYVAFDDLERYVRPDGQGGYDFDIPLVGPDILMKLLGGDPDPAFEGDDLDAVLETLGLMPGGQGPAWTKSYFSGHVDASSLQCP